jgi:hypothetical protein
MVATTVVESPSWLLGWKVVTVVPADPVVPAVGLKLYTADDPYPGADQTIGSPGSSPVGHAVLMVHVTVAVTV